MEHSADAKDHPLVRRLDSIMALNPDERDGLRTLPMMVRHLARGQDIVREGDHPQQCCLVLEGFTFRYKLLGDGLRQILSFHVPGDVPDLQSLHLHTMDHSLAALSPVKLGFIRHSDVHELNRRFPRIASAFWRDTLIDAAVFREWLVGIGRRPAANRIAHLLCELYVRLDAVGLVRGSSVSLPITQNEFADALGLSTVHINRSLQILRAENLISLQAGTLVVENWDELSAFAEFDPTYLHMNPTAEP